MFGRLTRLINNVNKLDKNKIFIEIISEQGVQAFIFSLNTAHQIFRNSEQSDGSPLTSGKLTKQKTKGYYSELTFQPPYEKQRKNPFKVSVVEGLDDNGGIITSEDSISVSAGDQYILTDTGEYLKSFRVVVDTGGFTITSNDSINSDTGLSSMREEYGSKIEGLTNESKNKLAQEIIPLVIRKVRASILA